MRLLTSCTDSYILRQQIMIHLDLALHVSYKITIIVLISPFVAVQCYHLLLATYNM